MAAAVLVAAFLTIYVPDLGHGFIKDDFAWIRASAVSTPSDVFALFQRNVGFYRPLVSASFAADAALWGLNPFGYGLTNLLLCAAAAMLLFATVRQFGLPAAVALLAASVWAFNFHGINMTLLWLSGRTALLAAVFALSSALMFLRGRTRTAGVMCLGALLCKEEAVMLPAVLTALVAIDAAGTPWSARLRRATAETWPLWAALGMYTLLRIPSGAFGPTDAPSYYRFSFAPAVVIRNLVEYADRAATLAVVIALALAAKLARKPTLTGAEWRSLRFAGLWVIAMYALTVFLPVRSSLYAVIPSLGTALAVGVIASALLRTNPDGFRFIGALLVLLAVVLIPVYRARNVRWVQTAETSARALRTLQIAAADRATGGQIVLVDDPQERFNLDAAFGGLFQDAVAVSLGRRWTGEIVSADTAPAAADLLFQLRNGMLVRVSPIRPAGATVRVD